MAALTYIRWRDASYKEGGFDSSQPREIELAELEEVGFLEAENDEAIVLGMERCPTGSHPHRWQLTIPKVNVVVRKDVDFEEVFGLKAVKKVRKKSIRKSESTPLSAVVEGRTE